MRLLAVLLLGTCLFVFGCSDEAASTGSTGNGEASTGTEVAKNCPDCGNALVDGKCAT